VEFRTGLGSAWLDLLATLIGRYQREQTDLLADPAALRAWLAEHDLAPAGRITAADVDRVREVREALHAVAVATIAGRRPKSDDARVVAAALALDRPPTLRAGAAGLRAEHPASARVALARLVRSAVDTLTGPDRGHLRTCGDDTCSGIFLDLGGRRRWCSAQRCGVRVRVRAHRARAHAQDGDGGTA